jgi:NDP-sugar pyrophosphorylase family protein
MTSESLLLSGIDAAILVGGLGTRLRGVVDNVPKPLAPVLGRPFLFYLQDMLAIRRARSVTLCSGYMADFVQEKKPLPKGCVKLSPNRLT